MGKNNKPATQFNPFATAAGTFPGFGSFTGSPGFPNPYAPTAQASQDVFGQAFQAAVQVFERALGTEQSLSGNSRAQAQFLTDVADLVDTMSGAAAGDGEEDDDEEEEDKEEKDEHEHMHSHTAGGALHSHGKHPHPKGTELTAAAHAGSVHEHVHQTDPSTGEITAATLPKK